MQPDQPEEAPRRCERCGTPPPLIERGPLAGQSSMHGHCAHCSRDLCARCLVDGRCRETPDRRHEREVDCEVDGDAVVELARVLPGGGCDHPSHHGDRPMPTESLTADTDGTNERPRATYILPGGREVIIPHDRGTDPPRESTFQIGGKVVPMRLKIDGVTIDDRDILSLRRRLLDRARGDSMELHGLVDCHAALGRSHRRGAARRRCADLANQLSAFPEAR